MADNKFFTFTSTLVVVFVLMAAGIHPTGAKVMRQEKVQQSIPDSRLVDKKQISPAYTACQPNSLVILKTADLEEMKGSIGELQKLGGCALHVFPPNSLIGYLPAEITPVLIKKTGIEAVFYSSVNEVEIGSYGDQAQTAAYIWNHTYVNPQPLETPDINRLQPEPLVGDVRITEFPGGTPGNLPFSPDAPGYYQTSEFMAGSIAVGIILPESNGALDPQTENWNATARDNVYNEIAAGLGWWATNNPAGGMSFVYDKHYQVSTKYEPINRPSTDDTKWISETLTTLGYTGVTVYDRVYNYLNNIRTNLNTDWAVVIYVIDSQNDIDGKFTNNYSAYVQRLIFPPLNYQRTAFIVMTYDNGSWTITNMDKVLAHEFGHAFLAEDEYCQFGTACCWGGGQWGYLAIPNSNCEARCDQNLNGTCDGNDFTPGSNCHNCTTCVQVSCIMRYNTWALDTPSKEQVGIRDTDSDGILDTLDTIPAMTLNAFTPDPTADNTPAWTGLTWDVPYSPPVYPAVTINYINKVEFRVDGGVWNACNPDDGTFNQDSENYTCQVSPGTTPSSLADGSRLIEVRSRNRASNYSLLSSDTLTIDATPPSNPTSADPQCSASNDVWQNTCSDPNFTWSGASDGTGTGVAGYYYYWGSDPAGDPTNWTIGAGYNPGSVSNPSINYLRIKTKDNLGNTSSATTLFTFRYDAVPPNNPATANPGCAVANDAWQNTCSDPNFTWSGASDGTGSGVAGYYYYWGSDPTGTTTNWITNADYNPSAVSTPSSNYLRVQTEDNVGNTSASITLFTFRYDATPPDSGISSISEVLPGSYLVSWSGTDSGAGVANYDVQYRVGSGGTWTDLLVGTTLTSIEFGAPAGFLLIPGETYYFRVRAHDLIGNVEAYPGGDGDLWFVAPHVLYVPVVIR